MQIAKDIGVITEAALGAMELSNSDFLESKNYSEVIFINTRKRGLTKDLAKAYWRGSRL